VPNVVRAAANRAWPSWGVHVLSEEADERIRHLRALMSETERSAFDDALDRTIARSAA
jgi:hypothetical protein